MRLRKPTTLLGSQAPRWAPIGDDYGGSILSPNVIRRVRGSCPVTAGSRRVGQGPALVFFHFQIPVATSFQAFSVHFQDLLQILS